MILTPCFWPTYRHFRRQERWSGTPISLRIFQFVVVHTVKDFSIVSEADGNVFWNSLGFSLIQWMLAIWYLVAQTSLYIWKFSVHVVFTISLKDFEHYLASKWDECNCMIGWTFIGIAFLLDWNENWPFPALWPPLSFPNLLTYWMQHFCSLIL